MVGILSGFAARTRTSIVFTFPPKNLLLTAMISVGKLFPRKDRAPFIQPVAYEKLRTRIEDSAALSVFRVGRTERIARGFYTSQALELVRET